MKLSQTRIAIILAILVATSSGCGVINRIRAKNQLNEAARTYREGKKLYWNSKTEQIVDQPV